MCIVCRQMKEKAELIRLVKDSDGIFADNTGKAQGRGAYICRGGDCIQKAKKKSALEHAFKCRVEESVYDMLTEERKIYE